MSVVHSIGGRRPEPRNDFVTHEIYVRLASVTTKSKEVELKNLGALEVANKIFEIGLLADQSTHLDEVLQAISERLLDETDACYVAISLVDEKRGDIAHNKGAVRTGPHPAQRRQQIGQGVVGQVVSTGRPFSLPNVALYSDFMELVPGMRSELAVPLKLGGKVIGALNLESRELGKFSGLTQALIQALATPVAQAIQNARLFHEERHRRKQLSLLNRVSRIIAGAQDLDELLTRSARTIREQLGYSLVAIGLVDEDDPQRVTLRAVSSVDFLALHVGDSHSVGEGVTGEVITTGTSLLVSNTNERANYICLAEEIRSEMCCPLAVGGEVFGFLDAESVDVGAFDQPDLMMLETMADHLSQAIVNKRHVERISRLRQDLSSMVVHDLRSPVTVIQSTLQLLAAQSRSQAPDSVDDTTTGRKKRRSDPRLYIQHAQRACDEMLVLIDSLLALQKIESGELQVKTSLCAPGDIPRSVMARLTVVADSRGIELEQASADALPPAKLDLDLISRVLQNLVGNALKFTPLGGRVSLAVLEPTPSLLAERLPDADRGLLFCITDTGPGIPEEDQDRIFDKFAVVESRRQGRHASTGLGLAFCKQAVKAHRGAIWVEPAATGGSIFNVLLPLTDD